MVISFLFFINYSKAQIYGCTDPMAENYNSSATNNDGSCTYNIASIKPASSFNLDSNLTETSGLILWNNQLWTHNDSQDTNIYSLDTINGDLIQSYPLTGSFNNDWEEISHDDEYIYIGDFGNNSNGNRTNMKLLKINKNSLLIDVASIDTINFSYSNQTDLMPTGSNNTDFDCEAFIVTKDSIFLFSKQWITNKTSVYSLPKTPGTYIAKLKSTYDVQGLITGATYLEPKNIIVLTGYSKLLQPFLYLLYDFIGSDYFGGNKRKIDVSIPFHQVEGIVTTNGLKYYISNEYFTQPPYSTVPQKLHIIYLNAYLENYFYPLITSIPEINLDDNFVIYPVTSSNLITIKTNNDLSQESYILTNQLGQAVLNGKLSNENPSINISSLSNGLYMLKIGRSEQSFKVLKK